MAHPTARRADKEKPAPQSRKAPSEPSKTPRDSNRDLVEQVVVALILAFVVRGFEAEAFVIPTGSMAPTLMGQHKEVTCPQCGEVYRVNASDEVETPRNAPRVVQGTCDNCRFLADIREQPSFKGDRILVMKFLYSMPFLPGGGGPNRWDIVVFKYPEDPETNYIKRLVGLPNEELKVYFGDILTRPLGSSAAEPFRYQRRPLEHQQATQMLVWNDNHRPAAFADLPEWRRWRARGEGAWTEEATGVYQSRPEGRSELRYANLVPTPEQWQAVARGESPARLPRPSLITDFYAYNSAILNPEYYHEDWYQPHWVGDLTLSCKIEPHALKGKVVLELIEGGDSNRCEIDLASGKATLFHGREVLGSVEKVGIDREGQSYDVTFANVDDRLTLWVDGETPFGDGLAYSDGDAIHPAPTARDLDPAGITTEDADVTVSDLVLKRDIYYTQNPGRSDYYGLIPWPSGNNMEARQAETLEMLSDPSRFAVLGQLKAKVYPIRPGHYMMMGDNSPRSKDSRGWSQSDQLEHGGWDPNLRESWEVPESLLIGKAFYVYWPHGKPTGPDIRLGQDFVIPFRPYFERMKWIK